MNFPMTVVMKKAHKKTFRAEVPDRATMKGLAQKILDNWIDDVAIYFQAAHPWYSC